MNSLNQKFKTREIIDEFMSLDPLPKDYEIKDNRLIYKPKKLIVLYPDEIDNIMEEEMENNNLLGLGIVRAYKYLSSKYINIRRGDVANFLSKQPNYQLTKKKNRITRPIIESYSNARWQVDLIDMNAYTNYNKKNRYILNCVDVFSRKCWLRKMTKKEPAKVVNAFKSILNKIDVVPDVVQTDMGTEFQGEFATFLKNNNITHLVNKSYSPNQNALVERTNNEVRKMLRAYFVKNNTLIWYDMLSVIETIINQTYNSGIKSSPDKVWTDDKTKRKFTKRLIAKSIIKDDPKELARYTLYKKALYKSKKYNELDDLEVGDNVRVSMAAIFSQARKMIKEGNEKLLVVKYTPEIFTIKNVRKFIKGRIISRKYALEYNGNTLLRPDGQTKYFNYDDLILSTEPSDLTIERALKLNRIERTANDIQGI